MFTGFYLLAISLVVSFFSSELLNFILVRSLLIHSWGETVSRKKPAYKKPPSAACQAPAPDMETDLIRINSGRAPSPLKLCRKYDLGSECTYFWCPVGGETNHTHFYKFFSSWRAEYVPPPSSPEGTDDSAVVPAHRARGLWATGTLSSYSSLAEITLRFKTKSF